MKRFTVSDHALVRYIERVWHMDLEPVRAEIAAKVEDRARAGASRVNVDGASFVIRHDHCITVTTVETAEMRAENKQRQHNTGRQRRMDSARTQSVRVALLKDGSREIMDLSDDA